MIDSLYESYIKEDDKDFYDEEVSCRKCDADFVITDDHNLQLN